MAGPKRRSQAPATPTAVQPTPASQKPIKIPAPGSPSWRLALWSSHMPNLLVFVVAAAAVFFEFTTHPSYAHSTELQSLLKHSFIVWVCLTARVQLADFVIPPVAARRPPSLRGLLTRHARALFVALAANSAGTTIIRPLFGAAPQYEETVRLVVPIYFLVEIVVDGLRVPMPALNAIAGLSVSWLKAVTISKLVMQWQASADAHPLTFVVVSSANLYASGVMLRFLSHYNRTHRVLELSMSVFWSVVQIAGASAAIGIVAHVANHFTQRQERQLEARALYFCVAWFALNKYWRKPLGVLLVLFFVPNATTQGKTKPKTN
ncbi:hypothetical protein BBJ28_00001380 [Nothophytophthora sp. Chile5]|nr:hypothetical protein BBJ28_00001380 [Nothophytophthora sp. Chile5]